MKVNKSKLLFHSVTRLLRRNATSNIRRILSKSHPSEIASVIRQLPEEDGITIMRELKGTDKEAKIFIELEGKFLQSYVNETDDRDHLREVLHTIPEDEVAALLTDVDAELADDLLKSLHGETREEVQEILQYGEDTCGRIMAVNVFHLCQDLTVREAIQEIQNSDGLESLFYVYVVDENEKLVGVVSLRQILQVRSDRQLKDFMAREVIYVNVDDSQEKAARFVEEYNFVSLPVINEESHLVGMVTVDDVIDVIRDEAEDEVFQLAGVETEAIDDFSFWRAFGTRAVWFGLLLTGGIACSEIILHFFAGFPKETILLCFAPLVLRLGGSIATQSITLVHQSILNTDIERNRAYKALLGQDLITLLVALLLSVTVFSYGCFRFVDYGTLPLALATGVFGVSLFSMSVGHIIPLAFNRIRIDSLLASSRFIHFMMDALSLLVFLKFQWLWLGRMTGHLF